jgi:ABC-type branched-subunit amino acid transport system substrate-binding protein
MGVVYRAHDPRLGRDVALKLLAGKMARDPRFRERFLRESRLAAATEHSNIVPVYEAGELHGLLYIAMRHIHGRDLGSILRAEGTLEPARAVELVAQLADALDAAHARGLIHRDVKPSNALVTREGRRERAYLVDFGITQDVASHERLTDTGQVVGTADYLAPERIRGEVADTRADVYSLACVLCECLTGEVPFPRSSEMAIIYAHLEEPPPRPSERNAGVPPALDDVVTRGLAKRPEDRWQTCGEMLEAARAALREPTRPVAPAPPTMRAPVPSPAVAPAARARQRRTAVALAGALALAIAALAVVFVRGGGDERGAAITSDSQVVALDAATGRVERRFAAGRAPRALAHGSGRLWVADAEARTLLRLDPRTGAVDTTATGANPGDVTVAGGSVWVANATAGANDRVNDPVTTEVVRLDPATQRQLANVPLPHRGLVVDWQRNSLGSTRDAVWALAATGKVVRIDPATATVTASSRGLRASAVAAGQEGVWALADGAAVPLDGRSARTVRRIAVHGGADQLAVGDTAAWVTSGTKLWRISRDPASVPGSVDLGPGVGDVVATPRAVWVANPSAGTVTQVDPVAMQVRRVVELGGAPGSLATDGRTVWVTVIGAGEATASRVAGVTPIGVRNCDPVVGGNKGRADQLVASDLPLQGDSRSQATQMAQAISYVLRTHRFRAGRFRIAYQSCDDALPAVGRFDPGRCAANGRAYARNPDLVAVIGSYNSGCTSEMLATLNRAKGGAVPVISPVNSGRGLTRTGRGIPPDLLGELYPTGRRNFVRVFPTDDLQGAALAEFARYRGRRRAFVVEDRGFEDYTVLIADAFVARAKRLGLAVVGRAPWEAAQRSYAALARRIRARRADAVLVSGLLDNNGPRLVRDLRAALGRDVDLLGTDGMGPPGDLARKTGTAALGMFIVTGGVPTARLPAPGRRFVRAFARTQPSEKVDIFSVYAAQATETLVDAIGRSDGTRASILAELFKTRQPGGLIGDVRFDRQGDIALSPHTISRVVGSRPNPSISSLAGSEVERIATVRADAAD